MFPKVWKTCSSEITGPRADLFGGVKHENRDQPRRCEPQLCVQIAEHAAKARYTFRALFTAALQCCSSEALHVPGHGCEEPTAHMAAAGASGQSSTRHVSTIAKKPAALSTDRYIPCTGWIHPLWGKGNGPLHSNSPALPPSTQTGSSTAACFVGGEACRLEVYQLVKKPSKIYSQPDTSSKLLCAPVPPCSKDPSKQPGVPTVFAVELWAPLGI